ncbi:XdhC family protein [Desulforegula conservatrix]|uniref:XdhC family protein n=1 Tax=Desulforegula conservatrix TaxID=153026 RepID=UPI0004260241|nr:XdhC/CoxI family protein [Desulforegula conservatrix]
MWIDKAKKLMDKGSPFVIATVVKAQGSTPRGVGARMIVSASGETFDTIGGGEVEKIVIERSKTVLENGKHECLSFSLKGDRWLVTDDIYVEGMCGGSIEILLEAVLPKIEVVIFGGGHIGSKLADLCHIMEIPCRIYDNRNEFASIDRFPYAKKVICAPYEVLQEKIELTDSSFCVVLTHGHVYDHVVLKALLPQKQVPYIGMIGSKHKVGAIIENIAEGGVLPDNRLYSPIGLNIGWRRPQEIALAIMAEIQAVISGGTPSHCRIDWTERIQ